MAGSVIQASRSIPVYVGDISQMETEPGCGSRKLAWLEVLEARGVAESALGIQKPAPLEAKRLAGEELSPAFDCFLLGLVAEMFHLLYCDVRYQLPAVLVTGVCGV